MKVISKISIVSTLQECQKFYRTDPYSAHPRKVRSIESIFNIANNNGWEVKELKYLVTEPLFKSSGIERNVDGEVIAVKPGALSDDFLVDLSKCAKETEEEYKKAALRRLQNEDIILLADAHAEGYIGYKTSIIRLERNQKAMLLGHLIKVRPNKKKINPYYLLAYLNSEPARHFLNYSVRGQTVGLHARDAEKLPVLLPPQEIQDSVGNKLKQAIEAKIEAEKKRDEIKEIFRKYFDIEMKIPQAISSIYTSQNARKVKRIDPKYFSPQLIVYEKLLYDSKLKLVPLGKIVRNKIRRGVQPQYDKMGEIPVIKTGNVYDGPIRWEKTSKVNIMFYKSNKDAQVPKNALVVTSTGEGSWGRTSINTLEQAIADGHITIVEIDEGIIDPYYVCAFLWTPYGKTQYERRVRGCTGQTEIYPMDIKTIMIPRLDKKDENEIAKKTKIYFSNFYRSIELHSKAMKELNELLGLNAGGVEP